MATWVVLVDNPKDVSNADTPHKVMSVRDYLMRPKLFTGTHPNIINLSRSYAYQGAGYYASLLAEARQHRVLPNVKTMIELATGSPDGEVTLEQFIETITRITQTEEA